MSKAAFKGMTQSGCHRAAFALVFDEADDLDTLRGRVQRRDRRARRLIAPVIDDKHFQSMDREGSDDRPQRGVMISARDDSAELGLHALTERIQPRPEALDRLGSGAYGYPSCRNTWHWRLRA